MKTYVEKVEKKYVIATLDNPTLYLHKEPQQPIYEFHSDISQATKAFSKAVMKDVLKWFYFDKKLSPSDIPLVVVPIQITYEILNEESDE